MCLKIKEEVAESGTNTSGTCHVSFGLTRDQETAAHEELEG